MRGLAAALLATILLATSATEAGSRGYVITGPLVAHGVSPEGVPWRIRAQRERISGPDWVTFAFLFKPPGYSSAGYFSSLRLPIPRGFPFTANQGSGLSPASEGDISGIAGRRVARLEVSLTDGSTLPVELIRPPKSARERYPWLRGLSTFDRFFDGDLQARRLTAFSASGDELARGGPPSFDAIASR